MLIEKLIKRKDEYMISGIGGKGEFFSLSGRPPLPFSLFFYLIGNSNPSFLQNSPLQSRQFTFK
jgi:hypothetical protein